MLVFVFITFVFLSWKIFCEWEYVPGTIQLPVGSWQAALSITVQVVGGPRDTNCRHPTLSVNHLQLSELHIHAKPQAAMTRKLPWKRESEASSSNSARNTTAQSPKLPTARQNESRHVLRTPVSRRHVRRVLDSGTKRKMILIPSHPDKNTVIGNDVLVH